MYVASLLFGVSASLDALLVGVSYGIRGIRIRLWQNLGISTVTLLGTCLSVGLGQRMAQFLPAAAGRYVGSAVLILLGIYYIAKWIRSEARKSCGRMQDGCCSAPPEDILLSETAAASNAAAPPKLSLAEVCTLSLTLSLNNVSAGLSASLAGLSLAPTAAATFVCSVLFLLSGSRLGQSPFFQLAGHAADPLSGVLLIGLGLVQLFL